MAATGVGGSDERDDSIGVTIHHPIRRASRIVKDDRVRRRGHDHDVMKSAGPVFNQREHRPPAPQLRLDEILASFDFDRVPSATT